MGFLKDLFWYGIESSSNKRIDETHLPLKTLPELADEVTKRKNDAERISQEKPLSTDSRVARESLRRAEETYENKFREQVQKEVERQLKNRK